MSGQRFGVKAALRRFIQNVIPVRGDGRREIARKILLIASVSVMIAGICIIISYYASSYGNRLENDRLKNMHESAVSVSQPSTAASSTGGGMLPEFNSLYAGNSEIKGWITIPKTNIDYPVVQSSDNSKYLKVGFDRQPNKDGAIFLDYRDKIKPLSQDLIIYGHNMKDGQMFNELNKYERREGNDYVGFYNSSPLITFNTLYGHCTWKIFAVFVTTGDSDYKGSIYYLNTGFSDAGSFNSFIADVRKRSFISTSVDVVPSDNLLTLSTCDYVYPRTDDGEYARLVVMARKVRAGESTAVAAATKNTDVVFPDYYYEVWNSK
jgi:sortase B